MLNHLPAKQANANSAYKSFDDLRYGFKHSIIRAPRNLETLDSLMDILCAMVRADSIINSWMP